MEFNLGQQQSSKVDKKDIFKKNAKPSLLHSDSESENEDEDKSVEVTGFNRDTGAVLKHEKKKEQEKELVIKPPSDDNWKEVVKKRVYAPDDNTKSVKEQEQVKEELEYGLNNLKEDQKMDIGDDNDDYEELPHLTESQAYWKDVASRPNQPTDEDYANVPVDKFFTGLLKGINYDSDNDENKPNYEVKVRPTFLGLGAKTQNNQVSEEMGAWGKSASKAVTKAEKSYTPVTLRDKRTGELMKDDDESSRESSRSRRDKDKDRDRGRDRHRHRYRSSRSSRELRDKDRGRDKSPRSSRKSYRDRSRDNR